MSILLENCALNGTDVNIKVCNKIFLSLLQIPITLHKETEINENGEEVMKCGFKIGGGIDQDFTKSPQGYTDNVRYRIRLENILFL